MTAAPTAAEPATLVELRYLDELRRRVSWHADAADALRARARERSHEPVDVLDAAALERLVADRPHAPRAHEWRAFLGELRFLADTSGRLPANLERLVRVVLADLLD
jgi:hypothetical protein